ncbi:LCP family protein [Pseudarthrobacter sp. P1]|uniref:LCP family protein n=1 Tax=Pseudarthrobacter sp. P1 TaxID=3418418 RepID=UPI003CECF81A
MTEQRTPQTSLYAQLLQRDRRRTLRRRRIVFSSIAAVAAVVLAGIGILAVTALNFTNNVQRSNALAANHAVPKLTLDTNILVMGLDTRVDEQGRPLSADLYDALNAGDESTGGYNANVLMLLHIPADGSKATALSIPRDDYVDIAGIPGQSFKAKIKEAYGYGMATAKTRLINAGKPDDDATYQTAREAGRTAEIATVTQFLGSVHIDHFVEVTMAAFYQVAQAIAPITVCVNQATQDTYSGANLVAGEQQIDGKQAMAFVRQRRDTTDPSYAFSDLDGERRQQAFIASVSHQLKQAGTFTDLGKMQSVLTAVSKNIVVDSGLNLIELAQQASAATGGNIAFTTLPITGFGTSPDGASVNTVDVAEVQASVAGLLSPQPPSTATASPPAAGSAAVQGPAASEVPGPSAGALAPDGQGATPASPSGPATNTYADWTGSLQGGGVPCVK